MKTVFSHMGIDQYGEAVHDLGRFPRKGLLERLGRKSARKVYQDKKDGTTKHVGYIVAGRWFTIYEVNPWEGGKV